MTLKQDFNTKAREKQLEFKNLYYEKIKLLPESLKFDEELVDIKYRAIIIERTKKSIIRSLIKLCDNSAPDIDSIKKLLRIKNRRLREKRKAELENQMLQKFKGREKIRIEEISKIEYKRYTDLVKLNVGLNFWFLQIGNFYLTEEGSNFFLSDYVLLEDSQCRDYRKIAKRLINLVSGIKHLEQGKGLEGILENQSILQSEANYLREYISSNKLNKYLETLRSESQRSQKGLEKELQIDKESEINNKSKTNQRSNEAGLYFIPDLTKEERRAEKAYNRFVNYIKTRGVSSEDIVDYLIENKNRLYLKREEVLKEISKRNFRFDTYRLGGIIQDPKRREVVRDFNLPYGTRFEYEANSPYFKDESEINEKIRYERVKVNEPKKRLATN